MLKLIGIPYDGNSSFLKGPALAPARIRLMETDGAANASCEMGSDIAKGVNYEDLGDLALAGKSPEQAYRLIKASIRQALQDGSRLISLGGDHSIAFPVIEAFAERYPGLNVLQLDAHADLYDNFDDNPYSHASPFARLMERGLLKSLTQVGIRTLTQHQRAQAQRFGVRIIEMKDFGRLDFVRSLQAPLYVSLDLDVLDPAFAPGLSHHEPGGMTTRELIRIIQAIPAPLVGADIVEYNPTRDVHDMTAMVAYKLFKELAHQMLP